VGAVEKLISPGMIDGRFDEWLCWGDGEHPPTTTVSWRVAPLCPKVSAEGASVHWHGAVPVRVTFLAGRPDRSRSRFQMAGNQWCLCRGRCRHRAPTSRSLGGVL